MSTASLGKMLSASEQASDGAAEHAPGSSNRKVCFQCTPALHALVSDCWHKCLGCARRLVRRWCFELAL